MSSYGIEHLEMLFVVQEAKALVPLRVLRKALVSRNAGLLEAPSAQPALEDVIAAAAEEYAEEIEAERSGFARSAREQLAGLGPTFKAALRDTVARAQQAAAAAAKVPVDLAGAPLAAVRRRPWRHAANDADATWTHIEVTPDVEIHVRGSLPPGQDGLLEQLVEQARALFAGEAGQ